VLEVLDCREIDGNYYKVSDVRTQCFTSKWTEDAIIAIAVITIFVVGFPLGICCILIRNRHKLFHREQMDDNIYYIPKINIRFGFVFERYTDECYLWEIVEIARKLLLTSLIVFVDEGSAKQVAFASLVSIVFLSLHYKFQPYITTTENTIMTFCLWNCCLIYLYGFLILTGEESTKFSIIIIALNVFVLLYVIRGVLQETLNMWAKRAKYCAQMNAFCNGSVEARNTILTRSMAQPMDADGDGQVTKDEFMAIAGEHGLTEEDFVKADADHNGESHSSA